MARWEFKLPDIGEGVTEGEIVSWLIKPGDVVKEDQPMIEVMTDKATVTITSPKAGKILETVGTPGEVVAVHAVLVVFDVDGKGNEATAGNGKNGGGAGKSEPAATAVGDIKESLPGMTAHAPPAQARAAAGGIELASGYFNDKPLATPATRKLARDMEIDLRSVPPTGPQGRVTKVDVESFVSAGPHAQGPMSAHGQVNANGTTMPAGRAPAAEPRDASASDERVPFAGMRRKIAQRMAQSVHTAAHFTFVEECDVTELMTVRARLKPAAEAKGAKLTFLPFVVKAAVMALKKHPILNSTLDEAKNELVYKKSYNIGIATSTDAGLVVPVVKGADRMTLLDVAREIERLATNAKSGKSRVEDLQGSTFTVTSLGADGGLFATPIINFPEVAILGVHQIKKKPVVRDGQIAIGDVMLLSLSFDHRIVDGHVGAAFAYDIIRYLQDPALLFLEMA